MATTTRKVRLHRTQAHFRKSPVLFRGFVGGRGSGKTWAGAFDLVRRARPGHTYLVASPTGVLMGDTTFPTFKQIARDLGVWGGVKLTPYPNVTLLLDGGDATVRFRTAEDPERLRGPNLSGVWLDEASLMVEEAFAIVIGCLREQGRQGWLSATFTPKGPLHWTYRRFGTDKPDTAIFRARTRDNPFNPPGFADTLRHQYAPGFARQELDAEFVEQEGAEWPAAWFPESLWFSAWPAELTLRVMGLDPSKGAKKDEGDYSAFACIARDHRGVYWVEADLDRRPTSQIVTDGLSLADRFERETGGAIDGLGCETDQFQELLAGDFLRVAKERGRMLPLYKMRTEGVPKEVRIRRLTPLLSQGLLRFRDTPGTRMLVEQMQLFPVGEFDDGPDATEYAVRLAERLWKGRQARR